MKFLDLTLPTPAENLACDEALLDDCEEGSGTEVLRFWESPEYFVVVGYANSVATEANRQTCEARKIPILRRCTGGGTVVQGRGCLNYSLILSVSEEGPVRSITSANQFVMERNRAAIARASADSHAGADSQSQIADSQGKSLSSAKPSSAIDYWLSAIQIRGCTDLAINDLKFSGNAQRRKRRALLFHGSFLLKFDLGLISQLLPAPSRQPDYRQGRSHEHFLTNLDLSVDSTKNALQAAWGAKFPLEQIPRTRIETLVRDKYGSTSWNLKF